MLARLRELLVRMDAAESESEPDLALVVATLLVELARADDEFSRTERDSIVTMLARQFELDTGAARELLDAARRQADHATSLHPLTTRIHAEYTPERKRGVLDMLWDVAAADGVIDAHEEHLVRKIAELLYVPLGVFTQSRAAARARHGLE
ncbi:MAG: TerB family tellurite resistance protein [Chromatiales bacterium]|nr:TerB family tellurite resistance protein [Chromatiales bacterium]